MSENPIRSAGPKLAAATIRSLESQIGARLPDDYREFLLEHNGGTHERRNFPVVGEEDLSWYDWLSSIDDNLANPSEDSRTSTLAFLHHHFGAIIPPDALAIGNANRDDPLLLFYRGPRRGQVHLRHVEELDPFDRRWEKKPDVGLRFVAPSFSAFLNMLQYYPAFPPQQEQVNKAAPKVPSRTKRRKRAGGPRRSRHETHPDRRRGKA